QTQRVLPGDRQQRLSFLTGSQNFLPIPGDKHMTNSLIELTNLGQSIWYDNIERRLMTSGDLKRMIEEDQVRGVTSNPAIFEKAISGSDDYVDQIRELVGQHRSPTEIYEALAIRDIQNAADILAPVFEKTEGQDGYVSLECSP